MKQRVAVALATVWLTSIVGASVPSGETTAFPTPRSPGPSPDQYTPLLRNPRNYRQDWMNDEPSRMKLANRPGNSDQKPAATTDSKRSPTHLSAPNEYLGRRRVGDEGKNSGAAYRLDMRAASELDREAMRLSSIKVAFDEPIDSEMSDDTSEEDWISYDLEDEDTMQQDAFATADSFEDEGPGSVEVYKLDLYKDRSILSPKPSRKNWLKSKGKVPKKVSAVDQINWKVKTPEDSRKSKTVSRFDQSASSRSLKDRIFGVGGVPELQVGCEGVEATGSERRKRSNPELTSLKRSLNESSEPDVKPSAVVIDFEYDPEDYDDLPDETDVLIMLLNKVTTTTSAPSKHRNRGDMDPRVRTPVELEAIKKRRKDKLPTRGDLGPWEDPSSSTDATISRVPKNSGLENPEGGSDFETQINSRRKLLSFEEEEDAEEVENNENLDQHFRSRRDSDGGFRKRERRGHRGAGEKKKHLGMKRRRRHDAERAVAVKEMKTRSKSIAKRNGDHVEEPEVHLRRSRLAWDARNLPSNSLSEPIMRQDRRRQQYQERESRRRAYEARLRAAENERKLQDYMRRNTPIPRQNRTEDERRRKQERDQHREAQELRKHHPTNHVLENLRLPQVSGRHGDRRDPYGERRYPVQEQRQREIEQTNRATYEAERRRTQSRQRHREPGPASVTAWPRSRQDIERLKALPVSARILIDQGTSNNVSPVVESRFNGDNGVAFTGLNPTNNGPRAPDFPSPATTRIPVEGPSPCVWAIISCCSNRNRLATCFETKGCPGGSWDPDPCSAQNFATALHMVNKYYGD